MAAAASTGSSKTYLPRALSTLQALGALSEPEEALLKRVEEFGGQEGFLVTEGLDHLERPDVAKTLFPHEKKLLPKLRKQLEWPKLGKPKPAIEPPSLFIRDDSVVALESLAARSTPIADLELPLQELASRAQLVANADKNASTICPQDVESALTSPGFTDSEKEQLKKLSHALLKITNPSDGQMRAIANVPALGETRLAVDHKGETPVFLLSDVKVVEERFGHQNYKRHLVLTQLLQLEFEVAPGERLLLKPHESPYPREDFVLEEGRSCADVIEGTYRLERWKDGKCIGRSDLEVPKMLVKAMDISAYVDFELRSTGDPLHRVLVEDLSTVALHSTGAKCSGGQYEYRLGAKPKRKKEDAHLAWVYPKLAPGRHLFEDRLTVDVFDNGAIRARLDDGPFVPVPWEGPRLAKATVGGSVLLISPESAVCFQPLGATTTNPAHLDPDNRLG